MRARTLCLATLVLTAAALGTAQEAAPTPPDPEFTFYSLGDVVVTADAPPVEVTRTTVVTAEEIEAKNARTVAEALTGEPGIRVSSGRKNEPNVSIHGFDQSKILVLVDGVPYYETNYGRLDLNQIPTDNIARIEVTKGAASVMYGANAMGGVVNIITRQATDTPFTGATVELGEDGLQRYSVTHGMRHGKLSYWLNLGYQEADGWDLADDFEPAEGRIVYRSPNSTVPTVLQGDGRRNNSDTEHTDAWFKLGWENSADSAYWLNLHYLDMTKGMPPATDSVTVNLGRPAFSNLARIPDYRDQGVDFDLRQRLAAKLVLKGKLFYHDHQDHYDSYYDLSFDDNPRLARSTYKDYVGGGSLIFESPFADWNTGRLQVGYKVDSHRERDDTYLPFAATASGTGSVGVEDELKLGDALHLVLGVSYDWFEVSEAERNVLDSDGDLVGQDPLEEPSEGLVNPMVGLNYGLGADSQLFFSAGRKSRFPLLSQLYSSRSGNVDLEPERSLNYDLGYSTVLGRAVRLDATGFWYDVSDLISRSAVDSNNVYQNYAKVRVRGLELGAGMPLASGLDLDADLTYTDAEDRSADRVTSEVVNIPEWLAGLALHWRLPWIPARLDLDAAYMDNVFTSLPSPRYPNDPVREVDSYVLTNLRLGFDVARSLELWGTVRNLLDESFESEYAYPGPGRAFSVGLSAKL